MFNALFCRMASCKSLGVSAINYLHIAWRRRRVFASIKLEMHRIARGGQLEYDIATED